MANGWPSCVHTAFVLGAFYVAFFIVAVVKATLSADDAQQWRAQNADFDWQQSDGSQVRIVGRGAVDKAGNLYFAGSKTYANAQGDFIDDENMFVARINADDTIGWTREIGTNETDGANFVTVMNETVAGVMTQYLYVVGWTWGYMDEGGHALNSFGRFGGRDVVLLKIRLEDGRKIWARQFGSTANDIGYGVQRDGGFDTLLLTGSTSSDQADAVIELDVSVQNEPRQQPFSLYETQLMDARARQNVHILTQYQFAASVKRNGDIVDFAMDGGVTISSRRVRITENSSLVGEYAIVLNRQPLVDVTVTATILCSPDPSNETLHVQQLAFVTSRTTTRNLVFTRTNWNREQLVRVVAVDDSIAEGVHYAVITHDSSSEDPSFNGHNTPFLYGRNITFQIDDNEVPGIQLSRRHVFVAEGDLDDTYEVVLRTRPWFSVNVTIVSLHSSQAFATPNVLTFEPNNWNIPQVVTVSAVDDNQSENEFAGLHFGGRLLHYSDSEDRRYRTGRPRCFNVPRCSPDDPTLCLADNSATETVRVCDMIAPACFVRLGNGACIARSVGNQVPLERFGTGRYLSTEPELNCSELTYAALHELLADQQIDLKRVSTRTNISDMFPFRQPPARLRGFILTFLGLLNVDQARQMHQDFLRTLQAICSGLDRLNTHRWMTQLWPEGLFRRVLNATINMFGGSVSERHLWQCGMASFRPGSSGINISIWDNDPGITLSTAQLQVDETSIQSLSVARYAIVLNAPPTVGQPTLQSAFCSVLDFDSCGLWNNFTALASTIYTPAVQRPLPNVTILILGNSQVAVSPSHVTFTSANWFVPQWISVRAINDDVAEEGVVNVTINHRVQNSIFGYSDDGAAFWSQGVSPMMNTLFPRWTNVPEAESVPYNYVPRVIHSPQHRQINVQVRGNDTAGVVVTATQPLDQIRIREADDVDDNWVGDLVKSFAFSELSLTKSPSAASSLGLGAALENVLVFEKDAVTFMKLHVPQRHEGDTYPEFAFARLRVFQTPFKVINASGGSRQDSSSSTAFETEYKLRITVVDNAWTTTSVSNGSVNPATVMFLGDNHTIEVAAILTKQRFVSIDVTPLMELVLPTRLPVVSLRILVLESTSVSNSGGESTSAATQLCSSLFERSLRPTLSWGYAFPNRLLGVATVQSSTVAPSTLAVDGTRDIPSSTEVEDGAWWEATLPELTRIGTLAIFVSLDMNSENVAQSPNTLIIVAAVVSLGGEAMNASEAEIAGCPDACPIVQRLPLRKALVITELNAGVRTLRIYREGFGALRLIQVEAYDPHLVITPTANGAGLRSRLKMDWNGRLRSNSWRLLQSIRQSEDENVALGMRTRQSSTAPPEAVSSLAVDGRRVGSWDPQVRLSNTESAPRVAGSTRTSVENDPWWEVDLGRSIPITSIELFPYVGGRGRGFCADPSAESSSVPLWAGDLFTYSKMDELLQLEDPFSQSFVVTLSDVSLESGGSVSVFKMLPFSCAGGVSSVLWPDVFARARFVRVQRPGSNAVLMLNEVVVTRWNPATTPQFLLLDLRGSGEVPIALSSVRLFPPIEDSPDAAFVLPVSVSIHSVSSQRASSGDGSAASLLSVSSSDCYVASTASFREWIVVKLDKPSRIGMIEVESDVATCGTNVSPVSAVSVSARGISLDGLQSPSTRTLLTATPTGCSLTALATLVNPATASSCNSFTCDDVSCRGVLSSTDNVVFSDFNDIVLFGVPSLVPTKRLPLSQQDVRAMLLRDNPVMLWNFETESRTRISETRIVTTYQLVSSSSTNALRVDDDLEQTFFSNAVAVQPAMSAFSIEVWVRLIKVSSKPGALITLATSLNKAIADIRWTDLAPRGVFTVRDPSSGLSCSTTLPSNSTAFDTIGRWYHVAASYDPSNARISLSVRHESSSFTQEMEESLATATCNLPLLSSHGKVIHLGAFADAVGFQGEAASVAWYVDVLTERQWLDHFHDFLTRGSRGPLHNSYALRLKSKPSSTVKIEMNAESACYYFTLCNITALPRSVLFLPENWNVSQHVRVIATDDQLYEGLHHTLVAHEVSSLPTFEIQSTALTEDLQGVDVDKWRAYRSAVNAFDRAAVYTAESVDVVFVKQQILDEMQANWSLQGLQTTVIERHPYTSLLTVRSIDVEIEDATVPGIQFSTNSLIVSENGRGNDYQILLLSEPTEDVFVVLDTQSDCYRECFVNLSCPSRSLTKDLACGGGSAGSKLCNVTVSPQVLVFTPQNWSFPQTVRVLAVDDRLDEADVHLSTIKATSQSLDPIYDALFLPDIVVAVEDNDESAISYSTREVFMVETDPAGTNYSLALLTEPWANVTIAMSNEADGSCYRRCGYPFGDEDCGLPRQQSVSSVRLASKSPREIHEISLRLPQPRVMEVQRIVTYADHVDHIFSVQVNGGFAPEVQVIEFGFNSAFKTRFKSATAVTTAGAYLRTFKIGTTGKTTVTPALDGFATVSQVETAINGLFVGRTSKDSVMRVTRELLFDQSVLRWRVTFLRFVSEDLTFPQLVASPDTPFEGILSTKRVATMVPPAGSFQLQYGMSETTSIASFPLVADARDIEGQLRDIDTVYTALVSRRIVSTSSPSPVYGFVFTVTFTSVESYSTLKASTRSLVAAANALTPEISAAVAETQPPALIGGFFIVKYDSPYVNTLVNATEGPRQTRAMAWNTSAEAMGTELSRLHGVGTVVVSLEQLSPEGGMAWTIAFVSNNGNLSLVQPASFNLTGKGVTVQATPVVDGVSLGGFFTAEMGGPLIKTHPVTQRVYDVVVDKRNATELPFNVAADALAQRLAALQVTEMARVTRQDLDCDIFDVCEGYIWAITYINSAGNLPPIQVYGNNDTITGSGAVLAARTVANGTYLSGLFSLELELFDADANTTHRAKTWNLPVNVSAPGMDQALEAIRFVRSNREAEYDPETKLSRGMLFDKGVRVYREGPYLDGGYTWQLDWAIEDYKRFQDLRITIDTSLVTQLIEPLAVPSELDLTGTPRCSAVPMARFQLDSTDPFKLRGFCVYDLENVTLQERYLCNYTVENPWIVFTPNDWCSPQPVLLTPVNDFIDETTVRNGNLTFSNVSHTVFSDDLIYSALPLEKILVAVDSDDVARVVVSESHLDVSEDGSVVAYYELQLTTEPLYDVKIVVLPWLDSADTKCYRFGLCNVTLDVDTFIFTPRDWNIPQRVVVKATDDSLDEYDKHETGISHVSYSADLKYHQLPAIPKIQVTVTDNDDSGFFVSKSSVNVTEGGATDTYEVVFGSEPFAKVTVDVQNVGTKGNYASTTPGRLVFTWLNWSEPQTVTVSAVDDDTQDPLDSSSIMVHSLSTNDLIYAKLKNLASVRVWIRDNDVSGIDISTLAMAVDERALPYKYSLRLTSEPWYPVAVLPNGAHDCYVRAATQERVCNVSIVTTAVYFGAGNWSQWQTVDFLVFDDALEETPVHKAQITHASVSKDPLYVSSDYVSKRLELAITDNDVSYVSISLALASDTSRSRLHVAEGGFNDSYSVVLKTEPYEDVVVTVTPRVERIVSIDTAIPPFDAPQVGTAYGSKLSTAAGSMVLVFTALDWSLPRVVAVFGIDDGIPEDPTQFSSISHSIESADPKYNISNSTIGIVDVAVIISDREAIPPPLPVSSVFDTTGTRILVTFDSTVYHAATMVIKAAPTGSAYAPRFASFSCSMVFSSSLTPLGSSAACAWRSDLKQLIITLGVGATVLPNHVLLLYDCSSFVKQVCQSTTVLRARHTSRSYTQATITVRVDPTTVAKPRIVVNVPEQVGTCGVWRADASLSTGSAGRPFRELRWFALPRTAVSASSVSAILWFETSKTLFAAMAPLCTKYDKGTTLVKSDLSAQLSAFISSLEQLRTACYLRSLSVAASTSSALQIDVDSPLLQTDSTYVVGLALTNAFAQQTIVVQSVYVGKLPSPVVFAVGDNSLQVSLGESTQPIVLQADATLSCPLLAGAQLSFRWFVTATDSDGGGSPVALNLNATNSAKDPRVFRVPRSQLVAGKTYRFRVDVSVPLAATSSAYFTVRVVGSPLVAVILGGNRTVGEKDSLLLNGSASMDPDQAPEPFSYTWRCEDWTNETLAALGSVPCMNASTAPLAPIALPSASPRSLLTVGPFTFAPQRSLRFYLTVTKTTSSKTTRTASTQTRVWTTAGSVPEVSIQPSTTKLNPSSRLTLNAVVKSTYPYTVRWLEDEGDLGLPAETSNLTTHSAFTMNLTSASNAIRRNVLTPGQHYVLRLVATDINGNRGFGLVSFAVNAPPSPGRFQVSPREGFAMVDAFSLECMQWTDDAEDLPLKYSFGVLPTPVFDTLGMNVTLVRQRMLPLVGDQLLPSGRVTMLPPDGQQDSADMTVVAFVADTMGGVAMASDSITVRMPAAAASQPVAFVSTLLSAQNSSDAATKSKYLFSAALVLQRALGSASSPTDCPGTGSASGICSGRGTCDLATLVCVCSSGFMGPSCEFTVADIRGINSAILSSLASSSVQAVEPSSSGLSQQALVVDTVTQSSSAAFDEDGIGQVTSLSSEIAQNAFALQDSAGFLDSTATTLLNSLSVVLSVSSTTAASESSSSAASASTGRRNRRLTDEENSSVSSSAATPCADETAKAKKSFRRLIATLQSVAGIASQDLLPGETPAQLASGQITTTVAAGKSLKSPNSALSVSLSNFAVACLATGTESDLFINAFQLKTPPHSTCSLKDAVAISDATVVTVLDKATLSAALAGTTNGVVAPLSLASDSLCVVQAATKSAAAGKATRRLDAETAWQPLVALSIPHARSLTAVEQRNFSTGCRAWNSSSGKWDQNLCFKDDTLSSMTVTVCYCGEISAAPGLEVLVTLEERLDFFALSRDLYRDDEPSIVGPISLAVLLGLFVCGGKYGQLKDRVDAKKEKEKTIANLNRSKWRELQERTQESWFEDFATFMAKREKQNEATAATSASHLVTTLQGPNLAAQDALDGRISIPGETRVLFGSNSKLWLQYETLTWILRSCNALLATIGVVAVFVGIDFFLVLGNSTSSDLVLFLYGKPIGLVLLAFGGLLVVVGLWGIFIARGNDSSPRIAATSYSTLLCACLLGQLFFVFLAFRYVNDLDLLPLAGLEALRSVWSSLSPHLQDEIQASYGCCGFSSIAEAVAGCPEEALDASPPLTCIKAVEAHARALFSTSIVYLQATFLVQVAALLAISTLQAWRRLRLKELVDDSASSTRPFQSVIDVVLYCAVPPVLQSVLGLMALVVFIGIDLLAQLHVLSNALVAGLLGIEIGAVHVVIAVVYAVVLLQGLLAFRRRDARLLQSFTALATACLLLTVALFHFVDPFHDHWLLDPAIVDFVHAKFLQLSRETLVKVETSLECCGFSNHDEGACTNSPGEGESIPTCRNLVLAALNSEFETLMRRALAFVSVQAVVVLFAAIASVRLKRFAVKPQIQPVASPQEVPVAIVSFTHALVHQSCLSVLLGISTTAFVFGLVVIGAGVDATYQLNVLHLSALLRVFDRHVAVYLLSAGAAVSLFGSLGVSVALTTTRRFHRRLVWLFVGICVAVFVAAFGLAGFAYRFAHVPLSDEALDERVESFWLARSPTTTRVFLQNALSCCGYEKIERVNGSVVFTDAGELAAWTLASDTVATDAYSTAAPTPSQRRRLSVTLSTPRRLTQVVCPTQATDPCAPQLKAYVRRVASRAFQLSVALLACVCSAVVAVGGLLWRPSVAHAGAREAWRVSAARVTFVAVSVALCFVALASFFLGLDVATRWSLFSSAALQLVFPRSIGVAFVLYAAYSVFVNAYAIQGVAWGVVHRVFLQSIARLFLILCGWLCVGLTGYASRYGGSSWLSHLRTFLDHQWDTLTPLTQHRISLEFQCCGFNDPVVVKGRGIVFDRPAVGYACSLAAARGCRHALETQEGGSFGWIFVFALVVTLAETLTLACGAVVLRHLQKVKLHEWFVIESRLRYAAGKYRRELRKTHVLLSLVSHFDRKLTRAQRLVSVLGGLLTTLAVYAAWFAHEGCHRRALKSCRQPDAWAFLGMGIVYGGLGGFAAQLAVRGLFEAVRNRSDDETSEVAITRQRKEKALLFRGVLGSRNRKPLSDLRGADKASLVAAPSLLESPAHATTEERWYSWLTRFSHSLFCATGVVLFLFGCGLATFMAMVLMGLSDSLYGVKFDQGPKEALVFGVLIAATALLAWLAVDVRQRRPNGGRSAAVFVAVAIAEALLLGGLCLGLFMASQTLDEDASNWTIRNTNFSVPQRLQSAWSSDVTGFFRRRVQQELQCCGFRDSSDAAVRPCPQGTTVNVQYEAVRVDGRVVVESKDEIRDLEGCYAKVLAQFHAVLDSVAYVAVATGVALLLLALCALFLAHDVSTAKDAKLKLRVATATPSSDVRETFEKVVGLKIAAPARGKILSKMLSASLENVAPHVVTELSTASLVGQAAAPSSEKTVTLPNGQVVSSSLTRNKWDVAAAAAAANVPYPAWITRVVFAVSGVWMAAMGYVVVVNSLELGVTTAWRCVAAWAVGVVVHLAIVEPLVVFLRIVCSTLGQWWGTTALGRLLRYGRNALRIRPNAEAEAARYYASLSLYERIRFNAAVRIQRRLATRLARRRFLQTVRERREQAHRLLVAQRRLVLKQSIEGFTAEEVEAFRLLFQDADTARLGLVSYKVISQSIYQLGVRVDAALVREFLVELDPAYADLVDFEHFLYGMHRVRVHHQEEQAAVDAAKAMTADERQAAALAKEEFVSSSSRFGPGADPQSRVLVKRQNLLRELREKRESLSYRLMSKVSKLPPLLQRGRSAQAVSSGAEADSWRQASDLALVDAAAIEDTTPTGSYVLLQNRKLSPKKRALEMMLKKKSREVKDKVRAPAADSGARSPRKMMPNLRLPGSPRARAKAKLDESSVPDLPGIPTIVESDETEPPSPVKTLTEAENEETKPFGTFMLLAKQTANAGKHKVMEMVLHKHTQLATAAVEAASDEDGDEPSDAPLPSPGRAGESRLTTAEKRERANAVAKSSLERALKKKALPKKR